MTRRIASTQLCVAAAIDVRPASVDVRLPTCVNMCPTAGVPTAARVPAAALVPAAAVAMLR